MCAACAAAGVAEGSYTYEKVVQGASASQKVYQIPADIAPPTANTNYDPRNQAGRGQGARGRSGSVYTGFGDADGNASEA